jgi:DNA-binding transcriptional MerR regulator
VSLVSIGEFARLSRLSPKALRRYDESGLLAPRTSIPTLATGGTTPGS